MTAQCKAQGRTTLARVLVTMVSLLAGPVAPARSDESWKPLMERVPAQANVLVMVHAEKVRSSGFAKAARWDVGGNVHGALPSILPRTDVARCVFAARLNLRNLEPRWETAVLETKLPSTLAAFALTVDGRRLPIGTTQAVLLPFDSYLLQLGPQTFGVMGPADPQLAVRWSRQGAAGLDSPYLLKIAEFPETVGTEVMLGIDLSDACDLETIRGAMAESPAVRAGNVAPETAARLIASIEGMALGVRVLDEASGMIRIDFTRDPAPLGAALKPLLLERLAFRGAMLEEFAGWTLEVKGNTAFFGGKFTPQGLSRVLSLVQPSIPAADPAATAAGTTVAVSASTGASTTGNSSSGSDSRTIIRSQEHYRAVSELATAVRFPTLELKVEQFGIWIDKQARRIDELPVLHVDKELLDYSQGVAKSMRVAAAKLRGASIRAAANQRNTYSYGTYYGGPGESDARIQGRLEKSAADLEYVDIMRMVDDETAAIRRKMTERYGVEF